MDERVLIIGCQNGQKENFAPLIRNYEQALYKYCYYLTGNEQSASDLFQDTWLKVMLKIRLYKDQYKFKNWLLSIASNTYKDSYRMKKRHQRVVKDYSDSNRKSLEMNQVHIGETPVEERVMLNEQKEKVHKALHILKDHYRIVIVLFYFEELSISEISETLKIPKGTVKSRLNKAKTLMRATMEVDT